MNEKNQGHGSNSSMPAKKQVTWQQGQEMNANVSDNYK